MASKPPHDHANAPDPSAALQALRLEHQRLQLRLQDREAQLQAIRQSWWWKLAWPLRSAERCCRPAALQEAALGVVHWVLARPQLAERLNNLLLKCPALHRRLRQAVNGEATDNPDTETERSARRERLSDFERFVAERLHFAPATRFAPVTLAAHAARRREMLLQAVYAQTELGLDARLLDALRSGVNISLQPAAEATDQAALELLVRHAHLALLRRLPPPHLERQLATRLIKGETLEAMLTEMRASNEFKLRNIALPE